MYVCFYVDRDWDKGINFFQKFDNLVFDDIVLLSVQCQKVQILYTHANIINMIFFGMLRFVSIL